MMTAEYEGIGTVLLKLLPAMDRQLSRELSFELRPHRMTPAQYLVVKLLIEKGELPPRKISAALSLDQSTIVSTLTRMERDGYVRRYEDPADGRSSLVDVTDKAIVAMFHSQQAIDGVLQGYAAKVSQADIDDLGRIIKKLMT